MSGFDEQAAIEEACKGVYFDQADFKLKDQDLRITPDRMAFVKGARYQHSQDAATIEKLEAENKALKKKLLDGRNKITSLINWVWGAPYADISMPLIERLNSARSALKQDEASR